ncbi:right-handed parallel beta-helix repeat-containing protein [Pelotomaculum propionicicum]|uniref:right-handed parallel beta-helix repeat-containing protein n=1 Tax=Pelotomaculum propionicicum TaxID=258475 RepID=UPI003B7C9E37
MLNKGDPPPGESWVSVKESPYNASGDGQGDDTAAIQAALDTGGNIWVPDGTYLINAQFGLSPCSGQEIHLSPNAFLKVISSEAESYQVFRLQDKEGIFIEGGTILGDRHSHTGSSGEWGMGVSISGCRNITIKGMTIRDCWGDGIYISSSDINPYSQDIQIINCICEGNRRQGLSVVACRGALIMDCVFSGTAGTDPQCGLDLEANQGHMVRDVLVIRCTAYGNSGSGFQVSGGTGDSGANDYNSIVGCTAYENGLSGIRLLEVSNLILQGNILRANSENGVHLSAGIRYGAERIHVTGNQCVSNKKNGIFLQGLGDSTLQVRGNIFANNRCEGNGLAGIYLFNARENIVTGNTAVKNNLQGISEAESSSGNIIQGNSVSHNRL